MNWQKLVYSQFDKRLERNTTLSIRDAIKTMPEKEQPVWKDKFNRFQEAWNKLRGLELYWHCKKLSDHQRAPEMTPTVRLYDFQLTL